MMFPDNAVTESVFLGGGDPVSVYPYGTKIYYVFGYSDDFVLCNEGVDGNFPIGDYAVSVPNTDQFMSGWDCPTSLEVVKISATDHNITIVYSPATSTVPVMTTYSDFIFTASIIIFFLSFLSWRYIFGWVRDIKD